MAISAKELAQKLGLSPATVSMVLNGKPGISDKTRQLVLEAAASYGCPLSRKPDHMQNGIIQYVIYKKHGTIVTDTPFFARVMEGIDTTCKRFGYGLQISYFYEKEDAAAQIRALMEQDCQGLLLLGTEISPGFFAPFEGLPIPVVVLDTYFEEINCDTVLINNMQGAYLAANYLIDCGLSQVGYLRSALPIGNFAERADGYYKALRHRGLSTDHPFVHRLTPSMEGAYSDMKRILEEKAPIAPAYFADNDLIAAGAMRALSEAGYKIPDDVSVIGFDDMPICEFLNPRLTTMAVPKKRLGELAAERLIHKIERRTNATIKLEVSTELVERDSVKK